MLSTLTGPIGTLGVASRPGPHHSFISGAAEWLVGWAERRRQLRALSELDDHLLRDLGLGREDVRRVCAQTFWMY